MHAMSNRFYKSDCIQKHIIMAAILDFGGHIELFLCILVSDSLKYSYQQSCKVSWFYTKNVQLFD